MNRNRHWLAAAVTGLTLAGCGSMHPRDPGQGHGHGMASIGDRAAHRAPEVKVIDGKLSVNPPVLIFFPNERNVEIVWRLPEKSPYRFVDSGGIEIEGALTDRVIRLDRDRAIPGLQGVERLQVLDRSQKEIIDCEPRDKGKAFACRNVNSKPGIYKYTVRVTDGKSAPIVLDPPVMNW